jgi:hypothetical protein
MGHCGKFGFVVWATAWNEVVVKSVAITALWATVQDLILRYGP